MSLRTRGVGGAGVKILKPAELIIFGNWSCGKSILVSSEIFEHSFRFTGLLI